MDGQAKVQQYWPDASVITEQPVIHTESMVNFVWSKLKISQQKNPQKSLNNHEMVANHQEVIIPVDSW